MTRQEIRFVLKWSTLIMAVSVFPYLYAYLTTPPGMHFSGWLGSPGEHNVYLMWMRQAAEGKWLFENKMTIEPHRAVLFMPFWLALGKLAGGLHLSPIFIYHGVTVFSIYLLLATSYFFGAHFFSSPVKRKTALVLVSVSSGLGWLFGLLTWWTGEERFLYMSLDLYGHETTIFRILHQNLHTTWGIIFLLGGMLCLWLTVRQLKWRYAVAGGLLALAAAAINPQRVATLAGSAFLFWLLLSWQEKKLRLDLVKFYAVIFLLPAPLMLYYYYMGTQEAVWRETYTKVYLSAGNLWQHIFGYGLIWPFVLVGVWGTWRSKRLGDLFLLAWIFSTWLLFQVPISQPIRFLAGMHIPLALLMTRGLFLALALVRLKFTGWRNYMSFTTLKWLAVVSLVFSTLPTNLALIVNDILFHQHLDDYPTYISQDMLDAVKWLEKNVKPAEPVLASFVTSSMLPGYSGNKVYSGSWTFTVDAEEKQRQVEWFYETNLDKQHCIFLLENGIRYVFIGHFEKSLGSPDFNQFSLLHSRYQNPSVTIYEVDNSQSCDP